MKCPRGCYAYLQAFAITVATILGTGILALPIELYSSGLLPFIFIFIICLCMQISVVYLMVELLQHSHVVLIAEKLGETTLNVFGDLRSENNYQKNNNIIINKNNKSSNVYYVHVVNKYIEIKERMKKLLVCFKSNRGDQEE